MAAGRLACQDCSAAARSNAAAISARVYGFFGSSKMRAAGPCFDHGAVAHDQDFVGQGADDPEVVAAHRAADVTGK